MKDLFKKYWWVLVIVLVVILLIVGLVIGIGIKKDKDYDKDVSKVCTYFIGKDEVVGTPLCGGTRTSNQLNLSIFLSNIHNKEEVKEYLEKEMEMAVDEVSAKNREELKVDINVSNPYNLSDNKICHYNTSYKNGKVREVEEVCH